MTAVLHSANVSTSVYPHYAILAPANLDITFRYSKMKVMDNPTNWKLVSHSHHRSLGYLEPPSVLVWCTRLQYLLRRLYLQHVLGLPKTWEFNFSEKPKNLMYLFKYEIYSCHDNLIDNRIIQGEGWPIGINIVSSTLVTSLCGFESVR